MFTVLRPGAGAGSVVVPGLAMPVKTGVAPSVQVMTLPVCEQVVAWAYACCGTSKVTMAVDTLLSNARRVIEFVMKMASLMNYFPPTGGLD